MKPRNIISNLVATAFLGAALAFGFWPEPSPETAGAAAPANVTTETITAEVVRRQLRFSGITRAARHAVLSFTVPARMRERPVAVGDQVVAGEVLARLDVREFDHALARSRAAAAELNVRLAQAQRDRDRLQRLTRGGAAATQDFERAAATVDAYRASLTAAQATLQEALRVRSEAELKAPFGGTITAVRLEPGEWAEPGRAVVELAGDDRIELEVDVPETVIGLLDDGQHVEVILPFKGGRKIPGRVASLARAALAAGRLFPLVVALAPDPVLTAGLTAELLVTIRTAPQLLVPVAAIVNPGASQPCLYVVENGRARKVDVQLGAFTGDRVAVSGNVAAGDRVVVSGQAILFDGRPVEVGP